MRNLSTLKFLFNQSNFNLSFCEMKVRRNHLCLWHDCQSSIKLIPNNVVSYTYRDVNYAERFYYDFIIVEYAERIFTSLYYNLS